MTQQEIDAWQSFHAAITSWAKTNAVYIANLGPGSNPPTPPPPPPGV